MCKMWSIEESIINISCYNLYIIYIYICPCTMYITVMFFVHICWTFAFGYSDCKLQLGLEVPPEVSTEEESWEELQ